VLQTILFVLAMIFAPKHGIIAQSKNTEINY